MFQDTVLVESPELLVIGVSEFVLDNLREYTAFGCNPRQVIQFAE